LDNDKTELIRYYGVKHGYSTGIYTSFKECIKDNDGYPNLDIKGFNNLKEAYRFVDPFCFREVGQRTIDDYFTKKKFKFYAVKEGYKTGIYKSYDEYIQYNNDHPNVEMKVFNELCKAREFVDPLSFREPGQKTIEEYLIGQYKTTFDNKNKPKKKLSLNKKLQSPEVEVVIRHDVLRRQYKIEKNRPFFSKFRTKKKKSSTTPLSYIKKDEYSSSDDEDHISDDDSSSDDTYSKKQFQYQTRSNKKMTYIEAAMRVLKNNKNKKLHYRTITRMAIRKKYIETSCKTPENTMNAALNNESNKKLILSLGDGYFKLKK
jgi:hypothetical protein